MSWNAKANRKVKRTNGLGAKESRLETTTSVWKLDENPKVQVKGTKVLAGRKVKGTNRLGAKESRLETATSVWKPEMSK